MKVGGGMTAEPKRDTCSGCKRRAVPKGWMLCRPCAVARRLGIEPFEQPCTTPAHTAGWPAESSCVNCGFDYAEHAIPKGALG